MPADIRDTQVTPGTQRGPRAELPPRLPLIRAEHITLYCPICDSVLSPDIKFEEESRPLGFQNIMGNPMVERVPPDTYFSSSGEYTCDLCLRVFNVEIQSSTSWQSRASWQPRAQRDRGDADLRGQRGIPGNLNGIARVRL